VRSVPGDDCGVAPADPGRRSANHRYLLRGEGRPDSALPGRNSAISLSGFRRPDERNHQGLHVLQALAMIRLNIATRRRAAGEPSFPELENPAP